MGISWSNWAKRIRLELTSYSATQMTMTAAKTLRWKGSMQWVSNRLHRELQALPWRWELWFSPVANQPGLHLTYIYTCVYVCFVCVKLNEAYLYGHACVFTCSNKWKQQQTAETRGRSLQSGPGGYKLFHISECFQFPLNKTWRDIDAVSPRQWVCLLQVSIAVACKNVMQWMYFSLLLMFWSSKESCCLSILCLSCKSSNETDVNHGFHIFPGYSKCVDLLHEYYTALMSFILG